MKRAIILGLGVIAVAIAAVPALVSAQGFPPPPPTTYYGNAPAGVQPGDTVIAVVTEGASSMVCGDGVTVSDSGTEYVVDVVADAQIAGCGKAGRTVQFYFVGTRALAVGAAQWSGPGPAKFDLTTLGPTLTPKNRAPQVAKDGVN